MNVYLFWCLFTLTGFQFAYSADNLKCATDKQKLDIDQLLQKWVTDGVVISHYVNTIVSVEGTNTKKVFRIDNDKPTADKFVQLNIKSGLDTFGVALVKPDVDFGNKTIRAVLLKSA